MMKFVKPIAITLALVIVLMGVCTVAGVVRLKAADKKGSIEFFQE